jgi:thymidylate kinase
MLQADDEALLARIRESWQARNGVPDELDGAARERAAEIVEAALEDVLQPDGLRTSILGPAWSRDLDLYVTALPPRARLEALGWIELDGLLLRLGHAGKGRWAVTEQGEVLALADLQQGRPPDRVTSVLARCRRRREVRAREVLELRALARAGETLPPDDPVMAVAAGVEAGLGGDLLAQWRTGSPVSGPAPLASWRRRPPFALVRRIVAAVRPRRRVVVAVSGLDGAGKSTLARRMARDLRRVGIPAMVIWTRPGMRVGWLGGLGKMAKRLLRQDRSAGVQRIGRGEAAAEVASRRGLLGWVWALMVTLSFVRQVRKEHRRGGGVLLYDRHLLDALVTLDVVYEGVNLVVHRSLVRRLIPRADLTLLLSVPSATALSRKPEDMFVEAVLDRQAGRYAALRTEAPALRELDGTRPSEELASAAFRMLARVGEQRQWPDPGTN